MDFRVCQSVLFPSAFGLDPNVSLYEVPQGKGLPATFTDNSEVILELEAKAACRVKDGFVDATCARRLVQKVWATHAGR